MGSCCTKIEDSKEYIPKIKSKNNLDKKEKLLDHQYHPDPSVQKNSENIFTRSNKKQFGNEEIEELLKKEEFETLEINEIQTEIQNSREEILEKRRKEKTSSRRRR